MLQYFGTPQELYDTDSEKFFNDALKRAEEIESKEEPEQKGVVNEIVNRLGSIFGSGNEETPPSASEEEEKENEENLFNF